MVAKALPEADTVHKVSIVPRTSTGSDTDVPEGRPTGCNYGTLNKINRLYGRSCQTEAIIFNEITTGAQNDIQQATKIARAMVTEFGMSKAVGLINLSGDGEVFVGRDYSKIVYIRALSQLVDSEVKKLLEEAYTRQSIIEGTEILHTVANRLLETETINKDEFESLSEDVMWNHNPLVFA